MPTSPRALRILVAAGLAASIAGTALADPTASRRVDATGQQATTFLSDHAGYSSAEVLGAQLAGLRSQLDPSGTMGTGGGGFTDDPPASATTPGSTQSLGLRMLGINGAQGFVNSFGNVDLVINSGFQSLGTNPSGVEIVGRVRQFFTPDDRDFIEIQIETANGSPLVPIGTTVGGQTAVAFGWELGATNAVDFRPFYTSINIPANGAMATFTGPGGQNTINHTPELVGPNGGEWNGVDTDNLLIPLGDLYNRVLVRYQLNPSPVPAPAGLVAVAMAGGLVAGRRRR
ncbi:MAG: hypothetical protein H6809_06190 [Phycisphaeraceae bacterium]|nr:hypothetical protein [Phycisphaeraceae bacterium]